MSEELQLTIGEAVKLGAANGSFYSQFFFPKTFRQAVPDFHREVWNYLDGGNRYISLKIFRDGAKTTLLRCFASKRIAYGISHTILYTSNSERHACRSVTWLKRQLDYNRKWAETFGLRRGSKWSESEIEIIHGVEEFPINVLAVGITGQIRGINLDDYRPDLIIADDLDNEETSGTPEQREKANELFFGGLYNCLASPTECPSAMLANLATPQQFGDIADTCEKDPRFISKTFGILDENGLSRWPAKFPTDWVLQEKASYAARNQMSLWMREKECKIISTETSSFRMSWLKVWDILPEGGWYTISIDPARSDAKTADQFAMVVLYFHGKKVFVVDYFLARGVDPDQAATQFFAYVFKYNPRNFVIETVAYQKILAWYLRREMDRHRRYIPALEIDDKRKKSDVILQGFLACAPFGDLYYKQGQTEFTEQYFQWHPNAGIHDDLLDAIARGITAQTGSDEAIEGEFERIAEEEKAIPALTHAWGCP